MEAKQYFIYLFRVKTTGEVIYVGSTRALGSRLNEHRRAFREKKHELPIHSYMIENNLELFKDVEVAIVDYVFDKEKALELEAEYFFKYQASVKNTRPAENRNGIFSSVSKPLICETDGKYYSSIREAAPFYGINRATIAAHLNRGVKLKSGLIFRYAKETENPNVKYVIKCIEDDRKYTSYKKCAEDYGMKVQSIYNRFRSENGRFKFCGKTFVKCND